MEKFLLEIGNPEYAGLWLCILLGMAAGLIWFAFHYRGACKWWVRASVVLSLFVDVPAVAVALSHAFRGLLDSIGFPAFLVLLIGIYIGF